MICGGVLGSSAALLTRPMVCGPQVTAVSVALGRCSVDVGRPTFVLDD